MPLDLRIAVGTAIIAAGYNDVATMECMKQITAWVVSNGFQKAAVIEFFTGADPFLIAFAMAHEHTVITHQKLNLKSKKVKIPRWM